jgi:putative transposase
MPRSARIVLPGVPHHLTQRGNDRRAVFLQDADYLKYLEFLSEYAGKYRVAVHGYCLMTTHSHLVLTPPEEKALARAIGYAHGRYAQYFNKTYGRSGHLWQNRFYSCALDDEHYWRALIYLERNPERARLVGDAGAYRWSSAAAHLGGDDETGLLDLIAWRAQMPVDYWRERLTVPEDDDLLHTLRLTTHTGRPLGSPAFLAKYEALLGKRLQPLPVGRPKKPKEEAMKK